MKTLLNDFSRPGSRFRGKPFWAWNGRLDLSELRRQIRVMKRMGLGGFFMHSRVGLDTPYLSKEWFDCVRACVDEAKRNQMEAWLYDEDRWPSGAAGGLVTKNPKHRAKLLAGEIFRRAPKPLFGKDTLAVFTARAAGGKLADVQRLKKGSRDPALRGNRRLLVFKVWQQTPNSWYNGYTYLDTMSHEAVREFIRATHEAYRKNAGEDFGRIIPGIFTDEPNHVNPWEPPDSGKAHFAWTEHLPEVFKKRYGYDVLDYLPEIFFDVEGREISRARWHFRDCTTFLFCDAFARQIGEWCGKNKLEHTGHCLAEESLSSQSRTTGSCMRFHEHMQAPGMDLLTDRNREYDTAKMVSSAARQFGRKWRLTETYGCTGWDFTFEGHKAAGDWQAALGINLRCQHLSWFTMEGQAKRDYPASILHQSPWWERYPHVEDYFARVHAIMTRGQEVRDILVIHPVESVWVAVNGSHRNNPASEKLDRMLVELRDTLLEANLDFDYGDEDILARKGRVTKRQGGAALIVGKARYKAVIVPPVLTIRGTTLRLLERFSGAGGSVIFAGTPAAYVDASPSDAAWKLARRCLRAPAKGVRLARAVPSFCRRISIIDTKGEEIPAALHLLREDREAFYLFVCNTGHDLARLSRKGLMHDPPVETRAQVFPKTRIRGFSGCAGAPLELDPQTGAVYAAKAKKQSDGWEIHTSLQKLGSRIFVVPKKKSKPRLAAARPEFKTVRKKSLTLKQWDIVLSEANVCVLDRPAAAIGKGRKRNPEEVLRVDAAAREALGIPRRGGRMVQPWAREKKLNPPHLPARLHYTFDVKMIPSGDLFLAIERPELYQIELNGCDVDPDTACGWWVDRSLRTLRLNPAAVKTGTNELALHCRFDENHPGFEIVYLLGAFGVKVNGTQVTLVDGVTQLRLGDWTKQGLPFYSGNAGYMTSIRPALKKGERFFVRVPRYAGVAARVLVDGQEAGIAAWQPNETDITDYVAGKTAAVLTIEVLGHRRNSHGPLHLNERNPGFTGPHSFTTTGKQWRDDYQIVPCGLLEPPELLVKKTA